MRHDSEYRGLDDLIRRSHRRAGFIMPVTQQRPSLIDSILNWIVPLAGRWLQRREGER